MWEIFSQLVVILLHSKSAIYLKNNVMENYIKTILDISIIVALKLGQMFKKVAIFKYGMHLCVTQDSSKLIQRQLSELKLCMNHENDICCAFNHLYCCIPMSCIRYFLCNIS